jgi:hypothetical protein
MARVLYSIIGSLTLFFAPLASAEEPREAETRILCLGDSNTFGLYYPVEDNWCSQLEQRWNESHADQIDTVMIAYPGQQLE